MRQITVAHRYIWMEIYLIIMLLFANNFFSFAPLANFCNSDFKIFVFAPIFLLIILGGKPRIPYNTKNKNVILILMLFLITSAISCYLFRGQSLYQSIRGLFPSFAILSLYFALHKFPVSERRIIKIFIVLATIFIFINIFQQISPTYYFGSRGGNGEVEIRMGLKRYFLFGDRLCLIPMFFYLKKWIDQPNNKNLALSFFFFLGIFFALERTLLFGTICAIIYMLLFFKRLNIKQWICIIGILSAGYYFFTNDKIEGSFIEKTTVNRESGEDDIRLLAIDFYTRTFQEGIGTVLWGNGISDTNSQYGHLVKEAEENMGYYRVDIGIFGDFNIYGLFFVIFMIGIFLHYAFIKRKQVPPIYAAIFMFFLASYALNSQVNTFYRLIMWPIILYCIDYNTLKTKKL